MLGTTALEKGSNTYYVCYLSCLHWFFSFSYWGSKHSNRRWGRDQERVYSDIHDISSTVHLSNSQYFQLQTRYCKNFFWSCKVLTFVLASEFEVNISIVFHDNHLVSENFPIHVIRYWNTSDIFRKSLNKCAPLTGWWTFSFFQEKGMR